MGKFIAWITSLRLAIGLIVYLAVGSILATLIPQGLPEEEYFVRFPKLVAELIVQTGFDGFFGSIVFILPSFLFFANLSACTVKRFVRELHRKSRHHHGPDVLHVGLMVLVVGAVMSFSGHQAGSVTLAPGDGVNLPDGSLLHLDDFRYDKYDDGRPRDWVSVVTIEKNGTKVVEGYEIRVNTPLRYSGLTFYQATFQELPGLALRDASGTEYLLAQGEERIIGMDTVFFMAPESATAAGTPTAGGVAGFAGMGTMPSGMATGDSGSAAGNGDQTRAVVRFGPGPDGKTMRVGPGDRLGSLTVTGIRAQLASGIDAVKDPGYPVVFVGLILVAFGTALTFGQKILEMNRSGTA